MTTPGIEAPLGERVHIRGNLNIPASELRFTADCGGGPGGQHVNKVSTRVTLHFDVDGSPSLTDAQRLRLREALGSRISQEGELRIVAGEFRSQAANKASAKLRFVELLSRALTPRTPRRATKPTLGSKLRRLESKKKRSSLKRLRGAGHE